MRTRARLDCSEWAIAGAKQFITSAGTDICGLVCITARTFERGGPWIKQPAQMREMNLDMCGGAAVLEATGERVWRLPLDPLYDERIKGRYADRRHQSSPPCRGACARRIRPVYRIRDRESHIPGWGVMPMA